MRGRHRTGPRGRIWSARGQVGNHANGLLQSQMLWGALKALKQSYDHLVIDAGSQSRLLRLRRRRPMPCWSAARRRPTPWRRWPVSCNRPGSPRSSSSPARRRRLNWRPLNPPHDSARRAWRDLSTRYFARR